MNSLQEVIEILGEEIKLWQKKNKEISDKNIIRMINYKVTRREEFIRGHMFNKIKYLEEDGYKIDPKHGKKRRMAKFECFCGNEFTTALTVIKRGIVKSCGCYTIQRVKEVATKHGLSKEPLYGIWQNIKNRCGNKNIPEYAWYGKRGIKICEEWKSSIIPFYNWCIEHNWRYGLSVDRIDVNGNYCPENCRLVTDKEQGRNKRNTIYVEYNNNLICLAEYCEIVNADYASVRNRMRQHNWSLEKAVNTERRTDKIIRLNEQEPEYTI